MKINRPVFKPELPLVHHESGAKIKLSLRKTPFAREVAALPSEIHKLHEIMMSARIHQNSDLHVTVAVWNKLRVYEQYWKTLGFDSEDEYLIHYDLPDGRHLASLTIMLTLFEEGTFVLLGEEVLNYMIHAVGQYQADPEQRKADYRAIFDAYCRSHETFDKTSFFDCVKGHVAKKYKKIAGTPLAEVPKLSAVRKRKVVAVDPMIDQTSPKLTHDFSWDPRQCAGCREKTVLVKAFQRYVRELVAVIRTRLGQDAVPQVPDELKDKL